MNGPNRDGLEYDYLNRCSGSMLENRIVVREIIEFQIYRNPNFFTRVLGEDLGKNH